MSIVGLSRPAAKSGTRRNPVRIMLGGYAALAESAWMGIAQASEVLDTVCTGPAATLRAICPRLPDLRLRGLLTREFSVAEASFILMASFFTSALLGAVRQVLFNAQFGVGMEANAYYAAFRLPDTLLGQAVGQAAFPRLVAQAEQGEWGALRRTLWRSFAVAVALAVLALVSLYGLGRSAIQVLFKRGEFTAAAGDLTFQLLLAYAVALPAYVGTAVITRGLLALRDTRTPLLTNMVQLLGRGAFMAYFVQRIGVIAIPAALAITVTVETLVLAGVLLWWLRQHPAILRLL